MGIQKHFFLRLTWLTGVLMLLNTTIVQAVTPACGTTLTKNTKLDADMNCPGTALRLSGNASKKVTLDCKGHSISTTDGSAIFVSNVTGVTIKNCVIATDNYFSHGIVLTDGTTKTQLSKNTITTTGANSRGIELRNASANKIVGNTIDTVTEFSDGIRLRAGSNNNLINKNSFHTDNSYSVVLQSSTKNKVYDNTLHSPIGFVQQKKFALQNGGLGVDSSGNIYAVENNWGSSDGIGVATAFFQVDPLTGLGNSIIPLLVGVDDIGFGFDALDILPNGRILALAGSGPTSNLYEIDPNTGQVTTIVLNLPVLSGKPNGLESIDNTSLLATTNTGELLNINLTTRSVTIIGAQGIGWTDVAAHPTNGKTYAVSRRKGEATNTAHLYEINAGSGLVVTEIGDTGRASISSIDFALDETLYANADGLLVEIDVNDASTATNGPAGFGPDTLEPFASKTKLKNNLMQNEHGSLRFPGTITLPTEMATVLSAAVIDIGANQVMIDSTIHPYLDEPGRITLENLTEDYLNLLFDPEDDGSFVPCESPQCKFISYLDGTLIFDVNGFTTYSSEENTDPTLEFVIAVAKTEIKALQSATGVSMSARKRLKAAKKDIVKALKFLKKGNIKNALAEISKAVADLVKAQDKGAPVGDLNDQLVQFSQAEVQAAIDAAVGAGGNQVLIDEAQDNLAAALEMLNQDKPDKAINLYRLAWVKADKSVNNGDGVSVEDRGDGTALVSWHPPTENEDGSTLMDLAGYRIYYGNSPGNYDNTITINIGMSSYLIENLGASDWYFAMTAFNSLGIESVYSGEVYKAVK